MWVRLPPRGVNPLCQTPLLSFLRMTPTSGVRTPTIWVIFGRHSRKEFKLIPHA